MLILWTFVWGFIDICRWRRHKIFHLLPQFAFKKNSIMLHTFKHIRVYPFQNPCFGGPELQVYSRRVCDLFNVLKKWRFQFILLTTWLFWLHYHLQTTFPLFGWLG
jgi:hypothetical protein